MSSSWNWARHQGVDPKESHSPATRLRAATSCAGPVRAGFWYPVTDSGVGGEGGGGAGDDLRGELFPQAVDLQHDLRRLGDEPDGEGGGGDHPGDVGEPPAAVAAPPGVGDDGADGDGRGDQRPEHLIRESLDGGVDLGGGVPVERQVQEPLEEQERPVQGEQRDPQQQIADHPDDLVQRRRQPEPGFGGVVGLDRQRVRERAVRLEQRLLRVGVGGVGEQPVGVRHPRRTHREQAEQPRHRQQPPRPATGTPAPTRPPATTHRARRRGTGPR